MGRFHPAVHPIDRPARQRARAWRTRLWLATGSCALAVCGWWLMGRGPQTPASQPAWHGSSPNAPAVLDAGSRGPEPTVVINVATQAYVPRPDEIPAEWAQPPRSAAAGAVGRGPARWPTGYAATTDRANPTQRAEPETERADFLPRLTLGINAYRAARGLPPLVPDGQLIALADEHSRFMAEQRRLSHDGFRERLLHTGSRLCVENVAHNFRTVDGVLQGWRASPGHHRNLLESDVGRLGLANRDRYVTMFACR